MLRLHLDTACLYTRIDRQHKNVEVRMNRFYF
ncbi:hypothetical protein BH11PSE12_BH11PSE12_16910 [soil metagenome]